MLAYYEYEARLERERTLRQKYEAAMAEKCAAGNVASER